MTVAGMTAIGSGDVAFECFELIEQSFKVLRPLLSEVCHVTVLKVFKFFEVLLGSCDAIEQILFKAVFEMFMQIQFSESKHLRWKYHDN